MRIFPAIIILCAALSAEGCGPAKAPDEAEACEGACANLKKLSCPEAATTPGGVTCLEVCRRAETSGQLALNPVCVAGAPTRAALAGCNVRCLQEP